MFTHAENGSKCSPAQSRASGTQPWLPDEPARTDTTAGVSLSRWLGTRGTDGLTA